jgi:lipoprotein NlpI
MILWRAVFPALAALLLSADVACAAAADDANAGVAAARAGKYDEAIEHFTTAINSDMLSLTGRAQAFAYRGIAKAATGDYDGAQEDLNFSVALDSPYNADALAFRGYFEMVLGDGQKAAADLGKSATSKVWGYSALWLALARSKAGVPDTDGFSLANNAMKIDLTQWPGTVVKYLMGQAKREDVVAAANQGDPARLTERVCDADFYVAEQDLIHNNPVAAKAGFQRAAEKCPFASFERMGAVAELARLK